MRKYISDVVPYKTYIYTDLLKLMLSYYFPSYCCLFCIVKFPSVMTDVTFLISTQLNPACDLLMFFMVCAANLRCRLPRWDHQHLYGSPADWSIFSHPQDLHCQLSPVSWGFPTQGGGWVCCKSVFSECVVLFLKVESCSLLRWCPTFPWEPILQVRALIFTSCRYFPVLLSEIY